MTGKAVMTQEKAREIERQVAAAPPEGTDAGTAFMSQLEARWRLCTALTRSGMIPQKSPEAALAVMLKGFELGVPPMQAFASIHFFDGKLTLEAALADALAARKLGVRKKILQWTAEICRIKYTRPGWDPVTAEFTIGEARQAGLLAKKNWKSYPRDMLAARAKARGLRMIAPDYFAGMIAQEETGGPVLPGPAPSAPSGLAARVEAQKEKAAAAAEVAVDDGPDFESPPPDGAHESDQEGEPARAGLNRTYFALLKEHAPELADSEALRKLWQEQRVGRASCRDWSTEDFELAILLVRRGQVGVRLPEPSRGVPGTAA